MNLRVKSVEASIADSVDEERSLKRSLGTWDLALMGIEMIAVPPATARLALDAFERYGKGRHPARLNFGDCFAYACARHFGQPLMFKGSDFAQTDIEAG